MNLKSKIAAFSLVEMVIALGIAAVSTVTTIAVLGTSINSRAKSADDTVLVAMTEHILSELRSTPFDALWIAKPDLTAPIPKPTRSPEDSRYYFSQEGDSVEATDERTYYECIVQKAPDDGTRSANAGAYNLIKVNLVFSSPYRAHTSATQRPNERILSASIARY